MSIYGKLQVDTPSDREIQFTRSFDAPPVLVWNAMTDPVLGPLWLTPPGWTMPVCEKDVRPGGKLRCVWNGAQGETMGMSGEFLAVEPHERLVHKELFDEDWTGGETTVTTRLADGDPPRTTDMTLTVRYSSAEARDAVLASPMAEGMESSYAKLDDLLAGTSP